MSLTTEQLFTTLDLLQYPCHEIFLTHPVSYSHKTPPDKFPVFCLIICAKALKEEEKD